MSKIPNNIPARSSPGLKRTAPSVDNQDGGEKFDTGELSMSNKKIRVRDYISIATWNVRTLSQIGKVQELSHEMKRYTWHILGLSEVRWKNSGEHHTDEGHILYYSGEPDSHTKGVGFLVNKDCKHSVLGYCPISSRLITIRLRATPFNITVLQVYAPTTDHDDEEVEELYSLIQNAIDKVNKKDIIIILGDWNAKVGADALGDWGNHMGPSCNRLTNERGLRLLEFASYNNLTLANTLGEHKASRRWTWHAPNGRNHNQIDYILVQNRFRTGINKAKTRTFPGADIGSDHDLVIMNFKVRLKKIKTHSNMRMKFNLDKLKDRDISKAFLATIGGRFAPLMTMEENVETLATSFSKIMTETATEVLGKQRRKTQRWTTDDILDLCDRRRELKKDKNTENGAQEYRLVNKMIRKKMKRAKEEWIEAQCTEIEDNLNRNNSRRAYQIVKELTQQRQAKVSTIHDKDGNCLIEEEEILKRWTEYCSELYNQPTLGDPNILIGPESSNEDDFPILRSEVEAAIRSLKKGKAAGIDNVPGELIQHGGEATTDILHLICSKIWQTGEWPTIWTQSLIITLPKKGNLQLCSNHRTLSLITHASKVMLRVILNRLRPQAEEIIAEEQAGFRRGRSTTEQIFNLRVLCEKYSQHQQHIYHMFIDFKKAFDKVWHDALWATMKRYNMGQKLIETIKQLYAKATSAVLFNGKVGEFFRTTVGVRQGCLLSPTMFNTFLEMIMTEALEHHNGSVSIGGRTITNLRFADDIDGLAGTEEELISLANRLEETSTRYSMEINPEKTKIMTNNKDGIEARITVSGQEIEEVDHFKYLGAIISEEGSKQEILSRAAQTSTALAKLRPIWQDKNISLKAKLKLLRTIVFSVFLYASETWTLTADLQRRINAVEMRCYRRILGISYTDHISNERIRRAIRQQLGQYEDLLTTVRKRKLKWYGHVTRTDGLAKTILQGTVRGKRKRGRQRKRWTDNIAEWTEKNFATSQALAQDRGGWNRLVRSSTVQRPHDPGGLRDQ